VSLAKVGECRSQVYLARQARQRCAFFTPGICDAFVGVHVHHHPPKGMGGAHINDLRTVALCQVHHKLAHGEKVASPVSGAMLFPIPVGLVQDQVERAWFRFMLEASPDEWKIVARDRERWAESRTLAVPF
jgi:hypothetical protein